MVFLMDSSKILVFLPSESVKKVFSTGFSEPVFGVFLALILFLGVEGLFVWLSLVLGGFFKLLLTLSYTSCYSREFYSNTFFFYTVQLISAWMTAL